MLQLIASASGLGDGRLDNIIIDRSAHLVSGLVVLVTMTAATAAVIWHAVRNEALGKPALVSVGAAQLSLTVQLLLGIKLLDQGQGILQLYIHYVGGLAPLGAFLIGGWFARGDDARSTRILAALLAIGSLSAIMAFTIGRAYANSLG